AGHNQGYRGLEGTTHYRRIWFLKPAAGFGGVWFVLDEIVGSGDHTCQLWYHFAPGQVASDPARLRFWTAEDGGNVLLSVAASPDVTAEVRAGIASWNGLRELPVACVESRGLPAWFATALVPFRGKEPPQLGMQLLDTPAASGWRAVWIEQGPEAYLCAWPSPHERSVQEVGQVPLPDGEVFTVSGNGVAARFRRENQRWAAALVHQLTREP
ncbi:MAG: heparinase II/III family protein, partial [Armatimonadetes bacterium]|nr:heparinase II/III family protein [Armatimonadota bacterium]